ncbi:MAG TPA: pyruvate dehydrogenase complex dihydrolipoamide acetyltransferase [Chthoniobacterales bacterium]|jgi:pyruvate dehydrogenase E2 component (dihydrolipoamide acetyltransferase)|nr:pyruvate dehydrogenase complex dihydrolipoamide acetyltransferase [Chthoniobacterales bacterium]
MPEIQMPKLSDTMTEGTLVSWKKKVGDEVTAGEVLAEIETDKATMEWESTEDGLLKEIYVEEGGKVNVGDRIAFIGGEGEEAEGTEEEEKEKEEAAPAEAKDATPEPKAADKKAPAKAKPAPKAEEPSAGGRIKASPLAKKIAAEKGVDLTSLKGTGPGGRIVEKDVEAAAADGASAVPAEKTATPKTKAPAPEISAGETARISLTGMRKVIAERLVSSLGPVPHFYLNIEIDADPLMRVRAELKSGGEDDDATKITVNDFILKAAVVAALREPKVNAAFDGDAIIQYGDINLAVAVAIDEGLVTPVIRGAQNKSLREVSAAVKDLAHRARNKRMKPEEFQGGTLTVSNLGSYGIDYFSAIINPPQAIILSIGAIVRQPIVNEAGVVVPAYRMKIGMSCDHRVVDGAIGASYLKALRHLLQNPSLLLL